MFRVRRRHRYVRWRGKSRLPTGTFVDNSSSMTRIAQFVRDSCYKRVHPKKRRLHTGIVATAIALLVIAFVLLLLVAISLPIVKAVYLFTLQAKDAEDLLPTSIGTEVRFGVWGYCATR